MKEWYINTKRKQSGKAVTLLFLNYSIVKAFHDCGSRAEHVLKSSWRVLEELLKSSTV